jgi:heptaprenyl diphosphate synthase
MPYLVLGQRTDAASVELRARIDDGVARIDDGADPAVLDVALADLRDHEATQATIDLAHAWSSEAVDALAPLPDGPVREALTRFAQAVVDRSN